MKKILRVVFSIVGIFIAIGIVAIVLTNIAPSCQHTYGDWRTDVPATCTTMGEEVRVCTRCGETEKRSIPANHRYGSAVIVDNATCTTSGLKEYICLVCGYKDTQSYTVPHEYDSGEIIKTATCTLSGKKQYTCVNCGNTYTESYSVGHTYETKWSFDESHHWHNATCDCGGKSDYNVHSFKNYTCTVCGAYDSKFCIANSNDLLQIANNPKQSYVIVADIDMANILWTPFDFSGSINGNGHTISNLTVTSSSGRCGMFTTISGKVSNIKFKNLSVESTSTQDVSVGGVCGLLNCGVLDTITVDGNVKGYAGYIGGVVGQVVGDWSEIGYDKYSHITNCVNNASVSGQTYSSSGSVGGVVGLCGEVVKIADCQNNGLVSNQYKTGGVIGSVHGGIETTLSQLLNTGKVDGKEDIGGVIGYITRASYYRGDANYLGIFENSGDITGEINVGGIVGRIFYDSTLSERTITFKNGNNKGRIVGNNNIGGVFGYINGNANKAKFNIIVEKCTNMGDIQGDSYVGGIVGYADSLQSVSSSIMRDCSSSGGISAKYCVGCIAGKVIGIPIVSCKNTGSTIKCTSFVTEGKVKYAYVGGFVGYGFQLYISSCTNDTPIFYDSTGTCVGGIIGYMETYGNWKAASNMSSTEISNCKNNKEVNASFSENVGGIVGYLRCSSTIAAGNTIVLENIGNTCNITGKLNVGGLFGKAYVEKVIGSEWETIGVISGDEKVGQFSGSFFCSTGSTLSKYSSNGDVIVKNDIEVQSNAMFGEEKTNITFID